MSTDLQKQNDNPNNAGQTSNRPQIQIDDENTKTDYANFCRVTGTPEELIIDFGLNTQPLELPTKITPNQRIVVNYYTAKRLLHALKMTIDRHEMAFGPLDIDIQKRAYDYQQLRQQQQQQPPKQQ